MTNGEMDRHSQPAGGKSFSIASLCLAKFNANRKIHRHPYSDMRTELSVLDPNCRSADCRTYSHPALAVSRVARSTISESKHSLVKIASPIRSEQPMYVAPKSMLDTTNHSRTSELQKSGVLLRWADSKSARKLSTSDSRLR